jgi:hypothetical protein
VLTADDARRPVLVRRGFILEYLTLAWNVIGIVVLAALAVYLVIQSTVVLVAGYHPRHSPSASPGPPLPRWQCSRSQPARPGLAARWTTPSCPPKAGSPLSMASSRPQFCSDLC